MFWEIFEQLMFFGHASGNVDLKDIQLWDITIKEYLKDPLWIERDSYDAGHYLMVPLHAAFINKQREWQQQFAEHFNRFVESYPREISIGRLNRLHYLYLASRYLVLSAKSNQEELIPPKLPEILFNETKRFWQEEAAWQWARKPFSDGIRERVLWKLSQNSTKKNYYRAIIDEELFIFAIGADLLTYTRIKGIEPPSFLEDILETADCVFERRIVWQENGGWLFQPGILEDHPDYAYAGHKVKKFGMKPLPVEGIAMDSSHSHRFPLWLTSLADAHPEGSTKRAFYERLKKELEIQLFNKVIIPPTEEFQAWRMTNYMDGYNGIYRWNYVTQGMNNGYGPYELSGTLLLGWWSFLSSSRIQNVYNDLARNFPLPEEVIKTYTGPNTTRERHPLVKLPEAYKNGMIEIIVRLASKISVNVQ